MSLDRNRIQALCFDVDGTLRDTDDLYVNHLAAWLNYVRFLIPKRDIQKLARRIVMGLENPAHFLYSIPDKMAIDDELVSIYDWLHEIRILKSQKEFILIPEVKTSLFPLSGYYPMAVVSARGARGTMAFLDHCGLSKFFNCIATGQTTRRTKPWPDPIFWAAEHMGILPENCLMIGDTTVDIRAGRAAGAQTIGVLSGFGQEKEFTQANADLILDSVADLPSTLLQ